MIKQLGIGAVALSAILLAGCQSSQPQQAASDTQAQASIKQMKEITGQVAYRERIALPPNAVLEVKLEDVSLADAKATVLSEVTIATEGKQVPLEFTLPYNSADIIENHRYALRIKLMANDKLLFINDTQVAVVNDVEQTHNVNVMLKKVN